MAQPIAQQLTTYAQQVQTIVAEAGAQFNMTAETNLTQAQKWPGISDGGQLQKTHRLGRIPWLLCSITP